MQVRRGSRHPTCVASTSGSSDPKMFPFLSLFLACWVPERFSLPFQFSAFHSYERFGFRLSPGAKKEAEARTESHRKPKLQTESLTQAGREREREKQKQPTEPGPEHPTTPAKRKTHGTHSRTLHILGGFRFRFRFRCGGLKPFRLGYRFVLKPLQKPEEKRKAE